ncbi:hypothetical protein PG987_008027 [Apiospora arundinis]
MTRSPRTPYTLSSSSTTPPSSRGSMAAVPLRMVLRGTQTAADIGPNILVARHIHPGHQLVGVNLEFERIAERAVVDDGLAGGRVRRRGVELHAAAAQGVQQHGGAPGHAGAGYREAVESRVRRAYGHG